MPSTRMLILGIDGANPDLLLEWSASGVLPNLALLLERGRSWRTRGVDGFFIGSTWPSIYTGATPARHGFHYLYQIRPGSYEFYRPADQGLFQAPPFWTVLSQAGQRMAILDAPLSPLDPSLNGIQVLEWGVHDAVYGFRTHPSALGGTLRTSFGEHPVGSLCDGQRRSVDDYGALVDALRQGADTKSKMTRHLLRQGGWDLFMQVFSEAHCAGHQLWHLHDRAHPAHNAGVAAKIGDPLQQVYRAIDTAIGEILDEAGDCMTFVFSSHGMSHWYGANFLLPEILFRLGVAQRPERAASARSPGTFALAVGTWLWHLLPDAVRAGLRGPRERLGLRAAGTSGVPDLDVDPSESRCFHHRNGLAVGGIRLNLAGREPQGTLAPGRQADEFCKTLIDDLTDIVDERSGRPLIRQILKVSDHYRGSHLADLPDLLVVYDDEVPTGSTRVGDGDGARVRVRSPKIGVVEGANTYGRTGEHRPQGLLIADGPGVGVGSCLGSVSVLDLAPTWTHLLGAELHGVDGAAIAGLRRIS